MAPSPSSCPRCGAPRVPAPECPRCGIIYARAEARAARQSQAAAQAPALEPLEVSPLEAPADSERPPHLPAESLRWEGHAEDARWEYRLRLFALPVALLGAWAVVSTGPGRALARVFLSMWVHELGHAVSAWLCGYPALPGPWRTSVGQSPSRLLALGVAAGLGWLVWRGWREERRALMALGGVGLALQGVCTVLLGYPAQQQLIYFAGDGGAMVLGGLLVATVYAPRDSRLREGWLRWGLLVIGAFGLMDPFTHWRAAREDFGLIAFGANEGSGRSDPSMLADVYHWSVNLLVARYVTLGWVCLGALAVLYGVGLWQARREVQAHLEAGA